MLKKRQITPKTIILDVLRLTRGNFCQSAKLISVGELFDFKASTIRVALTRLLTTGKIEADGSGGYRMSSNTDLLSDYIEQWRLGDLRRGEWQTDGWLMVLLPSNPDRAIRTLSQTTLQFFGFRKARNKVWVRPNNLLPSLIDLRALYQLVGLEKEALLFKADDIPYPEQFIWESTLWHTEDLQFTYEQQLMKLAKSKARLDELKVNNALRESFMIGGETINLLVRDPLLPDEMFCTPKREELRHAMCDYDACGHKIWTRFMGDSIVFNIYQDEKNK
ncbi:transcriptional regulator [uncultured Paraglaciecola sp.]|jgi:phenylacetic acid degradation operon negative regulatory protein|uniref:transcriptional regulator n=1 Tax=uncultured Paraglaciecola sp. TaxID=1765024 RepID=UPI0025DE2239|nr:transcriptional regulator [uncultured Paraglaciecola sp.]